MMNILLILILQLIYVPIYTLRIIFLVKQMKFTASILGFLEALIYVFGLSLIFSGDQSVIAMIVYALGFAIGIAMGGYIEEKLAIGYTKLAINLIHNNEKLISELRNAGFGVTVFVGEGKDSIRYQLEILTSRNREKELIETIKRFEPSAFIISYEPKQHIGGFLTKPIYDILKKKKI
ncbi:DUF2179 domain-containing protein [Bacillus massiliigorillae]|uniref:DUF2179 domain-containing protein n=1 Tax=Bacillus massiliigorillae TaxID=1243664 RepID=UPI00039E8539|nr:DUF2179 domain-containing protein [Bacillus massiliigorillae]